MTKKTMKGVLALLSCASILALNGCGEIASAQQGLWQSESVNKMHADGVTAEEETSIYDSLDLSIFDLDRYDNEKYLQYYWESGIMYNEAATLVTNQDGTLDDVKLLYTPEKIISVRSADLQTKYVEGVDYTFENGVLKVLQSGNIPVLAYDNMYFETNPGQNASGGSTVEGNVGVKAFPTLDGKYEVYIENNSDLNRYQIAVTYYHKDVANYTVPTTQSREFSRLIGKLEQGENVNIACLGDSISNGTGATGNQELQPYSPNYFGLFGDYIKEKFNYKKVCLYENPEYYVADEENESQRIKMTNFSVGGKDSYWGVTQAEAVSAVCPDLVILGFGMNDGSAYTDATAYDANIKKIVETIRKSNPECAFVLVSTMLPNKNMSYTVGGASVYGNQEKYLPKLQQFASEEAGVVVADITTLHKEYLEVKNFRDMTANNINHPNDFLVRLYAQTIVKTIFG